MHILEIMYAYYLLVLSVLSYISLISRFHCFSIVHALNKLLCGKIESLKIYAVPSTLFFLLTIVTNRLVMVYCLVHRV